jgi:hypothetical protein
MTGFGICYGNEPGPEYYAEFTGNVFSSSNGISLHDGSPDHNCASSYPGPYVKWQVIRNNSMSGTAVGNPDFCATINATNPLTSDLVVQGNTFNCPPGKLLPGGGINVAAVHSVVQQP